MNRIDSKFIELARRGEHPLIGYIVAGYPDYERSIDVAMAMIEGGVDILEIGIPFSDPIADGKIIQRASYIALQKGINLVKALQLASTIDGRCKSIGKDIPLIAMTYYNIIYRKGIDEFLKAAKTNAIDGVIVPDLVHEEASLLVDNAIKYDIDTIFLVTPNTTAERLEAIIRVSKGFLYMVSVYGTTGVRDEFEEYTVEAVTRVKDLTLGRIPLAVGFGVSKREHVRLMLNAGADAIVVGSAFINVLLHDNPIDGVRSLARELKEECKSKHPFRSTNR